MRVDNAVYDAVCRLALARNWTIHATLRFLLRAGIDRAAGISVGPK